MLMACIGVGWPIKMERIRTANIPAIPVINRTQTGMVVGIWLKGSSDALPIAAATIPGLSVSPNLCLRTAPPYKVQSLSGVPLPSVPRRLLIPPL